MKVAAEQTKLTRAAKLRFNFSLDRFLSKSNGIKFRVASEKKTPDSYLYAKGGFTRA